MMRQNLFFSLLFMFLILGSSLHANHPAAVDTAGEKDLKGLSLDELKDHILREKFDMIVPQVMREHNIDMWVHVVRQGDMDPLGSIFGSDDGIFVFTDRGGDRIERAFFGYTTKVVERSNAYDIVIKRDMEIPLKSYPTDRMLLNHF